MRRCRSPAPMCICVRADCICIPRSRYIQYAEDAATLARPEDLPSCVSTSLSNSHCYVYQFVARLRPGIFLPNNACRRRAGMGSCRPRAGLIISYRSEDGL